jgi:sec-independent protein translocase protein TatA
MPIRLGPTELLLILGIVVILFGSSRLGKLGGELGKGLREFRAGLKGGRRVQSGVAGNP